MRKLMGGLFYLAGACLIILSFHVFINCEIVGAFSRVENLRMNFWQFVLQSSGHHRSYPSGYLIHLARDLVMFGCGILIIVMGRENIIFKRSPLFKDAALIPCPQCHRKTYPDAYCRFCGFNLVTLQPSHEGKIAMPIWKVSLYCYIGVSLFLVVMNLLMIKAQ